MVNEAKTISSRQPLAATAACVFPGFSYPFFFFDFYSFSPLPLARALFRLVGPPPPNRVPLKKRARRGLVESGKLGREESGHTSKIGLRNARSTERYQQPSHMFRNMENQGSSRGEARSGKGIELYFNCIYDG